MKPPSTARTAGRSDRAERRFRRQSFILLFVTASSISLVSAENGENSLIPLRLLFPPNPLRWASAGALFSLLTIACRHLHLASDKKQHTVKVRLQHLRHKRLTFAFAGESGYTLAFANRIAHSGLHGETRGVSDGGWYHYPRSVLRGSETLRGRVSERHTLPLFGLGRVCSQRTQKAFGTAMRYARRCSEASRPRWAALLCCWFLRYTGKLRGSLSLHPIAKRKNCCWGCLVFACGVGDSSLVTEVRFLNRCSRRSMRETYPLGQRSGCRF